MRVLRKTYETKRKVNTMTVNHLVVGSTPTRAAILANELVRWPFCCASSIPLAAATPRSQGDLFVVRPPQKREETRRNHFSGCDGPPTFIVLTHGRGSARADGPKITYVLTSPRLSIAPHPRREIDGGIQSDGDYDLHYDHQSARGDCDADAEERSAACGRYGHGQ